MQRYMLIIFFVLGSLNILADESRDTWQKPSEIFEAIEKESQNKVFCDLGSGDGYFSLKAAKRYKQVYSSDISKKDLKVLNKKIKDKGIYNIKTIQGTLADALFPKGACDIIFMALVYHHIDKRVAYLKKMKKYLNKDGKFINLDNMTDTRKYKGSGKRIPARTCRFSKKTFLKEVKQAGFKQTKEYSVLPMQYLIEVK